MRGRDGAKRWETCSKVGMGFACMCVVIIEVMMMFSEQPFYIVNERRYVHTFVLKSNNSLLH